MRCNQWIVTVIILICFLSKSKLSSAYVPISNLSYEHLGPDTAKKGNQLYRVSLELYRSCNTTNTINCSGGHNIYAECSTSGARITLRMNQLVYVPKGNDRPNYRGAKDVSDVCSSSQSSCEVRGGVTGHEVYFLETKISLPNCRSWKIVYKPCASRYGLNNFFGGYSGAGEVEINTLWQPRVGRQTVYSNRTPSFYNSNRPIAHIAVGKSINYNLGGHDEYGDSLRYELTCPLTFPSSQWPTTVPMQARSPYTCKVPIPGIKLDTSTGLINFTVQANGNFIVAYNVNRYDPCTGVLKGSTYREVIFSAVSMVNNYPKFAKGYSNLIGGSVNSSGELEVCNGTFVSWNDTISDADVTDSVYITKQVSPALQNLNIDFIPLGVRNKIAMRVSGVVLVDEPKLETIQLKISDEKCSFPGITEKLIKIRVKQNITVGKNKYVCRGDSIRLEVLGNRNFVWRSLYGNSIQKGVNWFPDTNPNTDTNKFITFIPTVTTALEVSAKNIQGNCGSSLLGCNLKDTIVIFASDSFTLNITPDTTICNGTELNLYALPSNSLLNYSFRWTPSNNVVNDTLSSTRSLVLKHPETFYVTVESDSGCSRIDSVQVGVTKAFPQKHFIQASDTLICISKSISLTYEVVDSGYNHHGFSYRWSTLPATSLGGFASSTQKDSVQVSVNLTTASRYLLQVTDSSGKCVDSLIEKINVVSRYNTKPIQPGPICVNTGVTKFSAPTPNGVWSGFGVIDSLKGFYFFPNTGKYSVKFEVTGNHCSSSDTIHVTVVDTPSARLATEVKGCELFAKSGKQLLKGLYSSSTFSGYGIDSTIGATNEYWIDGTKFNPIKHIPDTAVIVHKVLFGCKKDSLIKVPVFAAWDSTYLGIYKNGSPIYTDQFCISGPVDTLAVGDTSAIWRIVSPGSEHAIIDSIRGLLAPSLVGRGAGGQVTLEVENKGYCGTKGTYSLTVVKPPQIDILEQSYCFSEPGNCAGSMVPTSERKKVIKLRVAKFPYSKIDSLNPATFVEDTSVSALNSGWNIIGDIGFTAWSDKNNITTPSKFEHAFCSLPVGNYHVKYQLGMDFRNFANKDSVCYGIDTATVQISHCLGLNENSNNSELRVYPNPFTRNFRVLSYHSKQLYVELYNLRGKLLLSGEVSSGESIAVDELPKGTYLLKIVREDHTFNKLIVRE